MWVEANSACLSRDAKSVSLLLGRLRRWEYVTQGLWSFVNIEKVSKVKKSLPELFSRV